MTLKTFYFNPYRECTYVLSNEAGQAVIIDAGMYEEREQQRFAEYITQQNLEPIALQSRKYNAYLSIRSCKF